MVVAREPLRPLQTEEVRVPTYNMRGVLEVYFRGIGEPLMSQRFFFFFLWRVGVASVRSYIVHWDETKCMPSNFGWHAENIQCQSQTGERTLLYFCIG